MRYSIRLSVVIVVLLIAFTATAQRGSTRDSDYNISYSYNYDDPYAFRKFKLHLDLLGLDWTSGNFPIHGGRQFNINPHESASRHCTASAIMIYGIAKPAKTTIK